IESDGLCNLCLELHAAVEEAGDKLNLAASVLSVLCAGAVKTLWLKQGMGFVDRVTDAHSVFALCCHAPVSSCPTTTFAASTHGSASVSSRAILRACSVASCVSWSMFPVL